MGGSDAFEPQELCKQIDALSGLQSKRGEEDEDKKKVDTENHIIWTDNLVLDDDKLQWNDQKEALCYFLFKLDEYGKWKYLTNVTENYINLTTYGTGYYCVRAANQRGGLGAATDKIKFTLVDGYELVIKKQVTIRKVIRIMVGAPSVCHLMRKYLKESRLMRQQLIIPTMRRTSSGISQ